MTTNERFIAASRLIARGGKFLFIAACFAAAVSSSSGAEEKAAEGSARGRPRFELLGMLDEYGGRPLDWDEGSHIEQFYPAETAVADHFETVLREFCADESLPPEWRRTKEGVGHINFHGSRLTAALNSSFTEDMRYGFGLYRVGVLASEVWRPASRADMLRYVTGAYARYGEWNGTVGKPPSEYRAFFNFANNHSKMCVLIDFLTRLGCTEIQCYDTSEAGSAPTETVLLFKPTAEIKALLGIRGELTPEEMLKESPYLKKGKRPAFVEGPATHFSGK